ncbi:Protein CBG26741 [Caenorhabditis briggsae]|uniref:Protein CBG26741 n=1 Tax=Caenorhabditis briggsae TaxID=6238 RepID=B6IEB6_CAEBR|nr:Protein CBG26741 [Caenorhabditis briggsae]CAS01180.1 Protein CBG26741 [Caenorhabditis briggsae]
MVKKIIQHGPNNQKHQLIIFQTGFKLSSSNLSISLHLHSNCIPHTFIKTCNFHNLPNCRIIISISWDRMESIPFYHKFSSNRNTQKLHLHLDRHLMNSLLRHNSSPITISTWAMEQPRKIFPKLTKHHKTLCGVTNHLPKRHLMGKCSSPTESKSTSSVACTRCLSWISYSCSATASFSTAAHTATATSTPRRAIQDSSSSLSTTATTENPTKTPTAATTCAAAKSESDATNCNKCSISTTVSRMAVANVATSNVATFSTFWTFHASTILLWLPIWLACSSHQHVYKQYAALKKRFSKSKEITDEECAELGYKINLGMVQIKKWFLRNKERAESIAAKNRVEKDHDDTLTE